MDGPAIVIAGSGMCTGGRILDHLRHGLDDPKRDWAGGRSLVYKFLISSVFSAPCLVVAHHEFFKNEGQAVIKFVEKLSSFIYQCHEKGVEHLRDESTCGTSINKYRKMGSSLRLTLS